MPVLRKGLNVAMLGLAITLVTLCAPAQAQFRPDQFMRDAIGLGIEMMAREAARGGGDGNQSRQALTPADNSATMAEAALEPGAMDRLEGYDLPGNDYNSGMDNPRLKGISSAQCESICAADGQCQAYTYNTKAKVCFLKSAHGDPLRFKGAISGRKLTAAFGEARIAVLTVKERKAVQSSLAALGYNIGTVDGEFGPRTRKAIAAYQAKNGETATGELTMEQLAHLLSRDEPAPPAAPVLATVAALPTYNGELLVVSDLNNTPDLLLGRATGVAWHSFGDNNDAAERAYRQGLLEFALLLGLANDPDMLNNPALTGVFVQLSDIESRRAYVNKNFYNAEGYQYANAGENLWAGKNQFDRRDAHDAWLKTFSDQIRARIPPLPIRLSVVRPIEIGQYADGALNVRIDDSHDLFPDEYKLGFALDFDDPALEDFPQTWRMSRDDARLIVESVATEDDWDEGVDERPVAVTQIELTGTETTKDGVRISGRLISTEATVYRDSRLATVLGKIPLAGGVPADVVTDKAKQATPVGNPGESSDTSTKIVPVAIEGLPMRGGSVLLTTNDTGDARFYNEYDKIRSIVGGKNYGYGVFVLDLLLALRNPDLLTDPDTMRGFRPLIALKRQAKYLAYSEETLRKSLRTSWAGLTGSDWAGDDQFAREDSREAWLGDFKEEILARVPSLPIRVHVVRPLRVGLYEGGQLAIETDAGSLFIDGNQVTVDDPTQNLPGTWSLDYEQARKIVDAVTNGASEVSGPVLLFEGELVEAEETDKQHDLAIRLLNPDAIVYLDASLTTELGRIPLPVVVEPEGKEAKIDPVLSQPVDLPAPQAEADARQATLERKYDILGVRLGMPLSEAEKVLAAYFEGRAYTHKETLYSSGMDPVFGQADPIFGRAITYVSGEYDDRGEEGIRLYFDALSPERPIIGVGRTIALTKSDSLSNTEESAVGQPVFENLLAKYGNPDRRGKHLFGNEANIWAVSAEAKGRVASGQCKLDYVMGDTRYLDGRFRSGLIKEPCDELLTAWFGFGKMIMFLTDTTEILAIRQHYVDEAQRLAAEKEATQEEIRF